MMKSIAIAAALVAVPTPTSHPAAVLTEVPITTMKDCTDFTVHGVQWKKDDTNFYFAIVLECKDNGDPV
jgi:hypothetical protein